jgi:predicted  nucleic acid-binding Zn-ribbon protein
MHTYDGISRNIQLTSDLNDGHAIQELQQQKASVEQRLNQLQEMATSLAKISLEFAEQLENIRSKIQTVVSSVSASLEAAHTMNNVLGEDDDISERLDATQVTQ